MQQTHSNALIPGCGFHHIAIRTSNWERSMQFWQEGIGFKTAIEWGEAPRRACMLDTGDGNYLEVFERDATPQADQSTLGAADEPNILHFCLRADDVDAAVERARAAGAQVTVEPKYPEPFEKIGLKAKIAFVKGPDGEICEFFQSDAL
jgi:glyoxylase I family protein